MEDDQNILASLCHHRLYPKRSGNYPSTPGMRPNFSLDALPGPCVSERPSPPMLCTWLQANFTGMVTGACLSMMVEVELCNWDQTRVKFSMVLCH